MPTSVMLPQRIKNIRDLKSNFEECLVFIARRSYLLPLSGKQEVYKTGELQGRVFAEFWNRSDDDPDLLKIAEKNDEELEKVAHGLVHVTRTAVYIKILHNLRQQVLIDNEQKDPLPLLAIATLKEKFGFADQDDIILLTQIAAFFHDSARDGEEEDHWDERSAENCYDFLHKVVHVSEECARFFANAIYYKTDCYSTKKDLEHKSQFNALCEKNLGCSSEELNHFNYIRDLIGHADSLDIMRANRAEFSMETLNKFFNGAENFVLNDSSYKRQNTEIAIRLVTAIAELIRKQCDYGLRANTTTYKLGGVQYQIGSEVAITIFDNDIKLAKKRLRMEINSSNTPYAFMENSIRTNSTFLASVLDQEQVLQVIQQQPKVEATAENIINQEANFFERTRSAIYFALRMINNIFEELKVYLSQFFYDSKLKEEQKAQPSSDQNSNDSTTVGKKESEKEKITPQELSSRSPSIIIAGFSPMSKDDPSSEEKPMQSSSSSNKR